MKPVLPLLNWPHYALSRTLCDLLRNPNAPVFDRHYRKAKWDVVDACVRADASH
jgi:hypothetical protein